MSPLNGKVLKPKERKIVAGKRGAIPGLAQSVLGIKTGTRKDVKINWIIDHDIGLHLAMKEKKNAVIVLYAQSLEQTHF